MGDGGSGRDRPTRLPRAAGNLGPRTPAWDDRRLTPVPLTPWCAGLPSMGPANEPGNIEELRFMADSSCARAPEVTFHPGPEDVWLAQKEKRPDQLEGFT